MLDQTGTVYILENSEANRIKVGVTINDPNERLKDINRIWLVDKGRCQICGNRRLLESNGYMPNHVLSGHHCPGSNFLPIEKDSTLAKEELNKIKSELSTLYGSEKGSAVKRIKSLEKLIECYRILPIRRGTWVNRTTIYTEQAYRVELMVHATLENYLDKEAPFGEVFTCSPEEAEIAIANAIAKLGLRNTK